MKETLTVLEAKRYGIVSCEEDATLLVVSRRMVEEDISALVVLDKNGFLVGLISQTDLVRASLETATWAAEPVKEYMTRQVVTVSPDTALARVGELLLEHCIHRVVVVQEEDGDAGRQRPVAVVASSDLVYHMVKGQAEG